MSFNLEVEHDRQAEARVADATYEDTVRHGGPYDRGSADSYYGGVFDPHNFVGESVVVCEQLDDEDEEEIPYVKVNIGTGFKFDFEIKKEQQQESQMSSVAPIACCLLLHAEHQKTQVQDEEDEEEVKKVE